MNNRLESSKIFVHLYAPDSLHFTYTVALLHFLYMYIFIYLCIPGIKYQSLPTYTLCIYFILYMYYIHVCSTCMYFNFFIVIILIICRS